jgi:hypothetical protein
VVPYAKADYKSRLWTLQDESGAAPLETGDGLVDDRLIGLQPVLEISDGHLHLTALGRHRAQVRSAILDLDPLLIECFVLMRFGHGGLTRNAKCRPTVDMFQPGAFGDCAWVTGNPEVAPSGAGPWPRPENVCWR